MIWIVAIVAFFCGAAFANATRNRRRADEIEDLDISTAWQRRQYEQIGRGFRVIKGGRR